MTSTSAHAVMQGRVVLFEGYRLRGIYPAIGCGAMATSLTHSDQSLPELTELAGLTELTRAYKMLLVLTYSDCSDCYNCSDSATKHATKHGMDAVQAHRCKWPFRCFEMDIR